MLEALVAHLDGAANGEPAAEAAAEAEVEAKKDEAAPTEVNSDCIYLEARSRLGRKSIWPLLRCVMMNYPDGVCTYRSIRPAYSHNTLSSRHTAT